MDSVDHVELVCTPSDYGHGANDGAYYPVGLLTIGSYLERCHPSLDITILDLHHQEYYPRGGIVGISASSTLCYKNVVNVAEKAKDSGALVVIGGPHATQVTQQILNNRQGVVDFVIRGHGELAFAALLEAIHKGHGFDEVPNLSWRKPDGTVVHNPLRDGAWHYDDFLPLNFSLLKGGIKIYWNTFHERVDPSIDASFVVFTHFGCGYRQRMERKRTSGSAISKWCSYCSLDGTVSARRGVEVMNEVLSLLKRHHVSEGSRVWLKCYGDNVGCQKKMLEELARAIEASDEWHHYHIEWTFYMQSSLLSEEIADLLLRVGTRNLFIGFDSADDEIQRLNSLGSSIKTHRRAARICCERDICIHAGFVMGCAGETEGSIHNSMAFAEELAAMDVLDRINTAILVVMPGAPNYTLLCRKEPWIRELDYLDTEEIRWYWLRHFCPDLGKHPSHGLEILQKAANDLDDLCPGPHASMGFISKRLEETQISAGTIR